MSMIRTAKRQDSRPDPAPEPPMFDRRTFDPSTLQGEALARIRTELTTCRDRLDELLEHEGLYVVIQGTEIVGYHKTLQAARRSAIREFGATPVLIKKVAEREPIRTVGGRVVICRP